ncbi:serine protease [uncultured Algibacter sp.]|uniref:S1 family peptidase n=1 Tax=uncultured Algibacter sp. TaxID=298659 RepID=UPI0026069BC5|nr:serine protease [uncultured Algibacter sp.]
MKLTLLLFLIFPLKIIGQAIQPESVQSLYFETYKGNIKLGSATGFVIKSKTKNYLVTNYHVLTNKNPKNGEWLDSKKPFSPDNIKIMHNANILGNYVVCSEKLFDKTGKKLWHENKIGKEMVDVVELPLTDTIRAKIYPVNYKTSSYDNVVITVTERIFILGFPLGIKSAPFFPIWKSGLIASEPATDQENKPIIWVDAITYPGMSGSPVYFKTDDVVKFKNGRHGMVQGDTAKFMGVFSHSHKFNVYGALWKASFLEKIFDDLP